MPFSRRRPRSCPPTARLVAISRTTTGPCATVIQDSQFDFRRRPRRTVRFAESAEARIATEILNEAAEWTKQFGCPIWPPEEIHFHKIREAALAEALVVGIEKNSIVACMQVYDRDQVHWPDDSSPALYLHKLAVRRSAAGRGWLEDLIYWALRRARAKKARLLRLDTIPAGRLPELYSRFGFREIDPEPRLIDGRLLVRMERRVGWAPPRDLALEGALK